MKAADLVSLESGTKFKNATPLGVIYDLPTGGDGFRRVTLTAEGVAKGKADVKFV